MRLVEPEELQAFGVALASRLPCHQIHPPELVRDTLEGELVRKATKHLVRHYVANRFRHCSVVIEPPVRRISIVSPEELVSTISAEYHLHVPRCHASQMQQADG